MTEEWKPVLGGVYAASSRGRIRRVNSVHSRLGVLKPYLEESGYLTVKPSINGKTKTYYVHYLVTLAFYGVRPTDYEVNHKDGVKTNNTPDNLEYVTSEQNIAHGIATGLIPHNGEENGYSKLTEARVLKIRQLKLAGKSTKEIAKKYKVHHTTISHILRGKNWSWLTP